MDRRPAPRPWVLFLAIFVLSIPLFVLGSFSSARLLPGLPLSARMFLSIAAVALWAAWRTRGLAGMRELLGRVLDARRASPWTWHLVSVLVFPALLLLEYVLMRLAHAHVPSPLVPWLQAPVLFVLFFVAAACEEVAWSATLLEPLRARWGALGGSLLIGVFAAALHVIPFSQAHSDVSWIVGQSVFTVGFRVVVAWIYNVSGSSLFAAVLCHAAYNTGWQLFPNQGSGYSPWITAGLTWVVVGAIIAIYGARTLGGRHPASPST